MTLAYRSIGSVEGRRSDPLGSGGRPGVLNVTLSLVDRGKGRAGVGSMQAGQLAGVCRSMGTIGDSSCSFRPVGVVMVRSPTRDHSLGYLWWTCWVLSCWLLDGWVALFPGEDQGLLGISFQESPGTRPSGLLGSSFSMSYCGFEFYLHVGRSARALGTSIVSGLLPLGWSPCCLGWGFRPEYGLMCSPPGSQYCGLVWLLGDSLLVLRLFMTLCCCYCIELPRGKGHARGSHGVGLPRGPEGSLRVLPKRLRARRSGGILLCRSDFPRHWDGALLRWPRTHWLGGPLGCRPWVLEGLGHLLYVSRQKPGPGRLAGSLGECLLSSKGLGSRSSLSIPWLKGSGFLGVSTCFHLVTGLVLGWWGGVIDNFEITFVQAIEDLVHPPHLPLRSSPC